LDKTVIVNTETLNIENEEELKKSIEKITNTFKMILTSAYESNLKSIMYIPAVVSDKDVKIIVK
jgi:hypothetical protein